VETKTGQRENHGFSSAEFEPGSCPLLVVFSCDCLNDKAGVHEARALRGARDQRQPKTRAQ
jgi:hypothetical protein